MAKVKALTSFCGVVTMAKDEVMEISDKFILHDLKKAGYITEIKEKGSDKNESK